MNASLILQGTLLAAIFMLTFISCSQLLEEILQSASRKSRLRHVRHPLWRRRFRRLGNAPPMLLRHVQDLLEALQMKMKATSLLLISFIGLWIGASAGAYIFQSLKGVAMLSCMLAAVPYGWLRMRLISRQMRSRLDFLPAVEVFYQYYLMAETRNIRQVLSVCLAERRLRMPVRASFELLHRHLSTNRPVDDALRIFSYSLGHTWGQYMSNLLRVGLTEGADLSASLHDLIADMRQAQAADQAARNRLLEIRIANFSPPVFFVLFIAINFRLNGDQAYFYYLIDPSGRNMLLNGLILMFASFVMGIWLSIRRM